MSEHTDDFGEVQNVVPHLDLDAIEERLARRDPEVRAARLNRVQSFLIGNGVDKSEIDGSV